MQFCRLAFCLTLACGALASAPCTGVGASGTEACGREEQDPVALMQLKSNVQRGGSLAAKMEMPIPVGRTMISTDPKTSAGFFTKYFDAKDLPVPACSHQEAAAVEIQTGWGMTATYVFVKDTTLPAGTLNSSALVAEVEAKIADVFAGKAGKYNAWIDNHDGFNQSSFKYKQALADGVNVGIFDWTYTENVFGIVRFYIPNTLFTFELVAPKSDLDQYNLPEYLADDCRDDVNMPDPTPVFGTVQPWFKTTFMAAMPGMGGGWAKDILGAVDFKAPYPWPPVPGCTEAVWVIFPEYSYMMHFVLSNEFQTSSELESSKGTVQAFTDDVKSFRQLGAGVFDHFMLNNLIMQLDSLDPLILRLQAKGYPFLLTRVGEEYALFTDVPENAQTVQFRSAHVTLAEPVTLDGVCLV